MHELDTFDEELPATGRHRVPPAPLRRVLLRMGAGAGALLVVAVLAVLTASWMGLTDTPPTATEPIPPPTPAVASAGPTFGRTLDLDATRADRAARRSATEAPETAAQSPSPLATEAAGAGAGSRGGATAATGAGPRAGRAAG